MSAPVARSPWREALRRLVRHRLALAGLVVVGLVATIGFSAPLVARFVTGFSLDEQHPAMRLKPPGTRDISYDHRSYDGDRSHFAALDRDKSGAISGARELGELYWIDRFLGFLFSDYDLVSPGEELTAALRARKPAGSHPDDRVSRAEYPRGYDELDASFREELVAFVRARAPSAERTDDAAIDRRARAYVARLGIGRAALFSRIDRDGDGLLTLNEVNHLRRRYRPFENAERALAAMDTNRDGKITRAEYPGAPELRTFWLGTDRLGRDVLTRLCYGARISILIAVLATLVSFLIGTSWGAVAGYYGGRTDSVMMRVVDVLYGLPFMFIVILLIVIFGRSTINLFIALGAVQWLTMSRVVRGQVLSLKNREFIEAAIALGVSRRTIVFRHLVRNAVGPVIVYATLMVPAIILEEAFLSFLGLGVQPPNASWGNMISEGAKVMQSHPWLIVYPALVLGVTLFSLNFIGDGLRDALDPKTAKR
ncbi:MAG: ABC transporter permease subunit [Myxococcales bacterium]|nr:ABC transporter permease subunit [Myxococcales bacterium]